MVVQKNIKHVNIYVFNIKFKDIQRRAQSLHSEISVGHRCLMSIILATQGAEIKRIMVQSQPRKIISEMLSRKYLSQKSASGVAQGVGPEFKPSNTKKINK
jgi:GTPase Era involved in 16S rRNA processing